MLDSRIPAVRRRVVNRQPLRPERAYVVYWMIAARRLTANYALERAVELARRLKRPLIVFEPLRVDYPWASDRVHRFVLDGMREHRDRLRDTRALYYPWVERSPGAGKGLLAALARQAAAVVTDEYPAFFLPAMVESAGRQLDVLLEAVDANGLLPLRAADRAYPTAHAFRRALHRLLPDALSAPPANHPMQGAPLPAGSLPGEVLGRWTPADDDLLVGEPGALARLPLDHDVRPVGVGGAEAGRQRLSAWLEDGFDRFAADRNQPLSGAASGLSPWLHFGHLGVWEVFRAVAEREAWHPARLGKPTGARAGWWGMGENAEAFLDELVSWREVGFNGASWQPGTWDGWASLPDWARRTLENHGADRREWTYDLRTLRDGATHDDLWNAAQRQLMGQGTIEGYLRMLWGKKILEWTPSPHRAIEIMVELNNRFALDGRDPSSWSGILWCLGKYDRAWGPERPVYGTVRYMSSQSTRRKLKLARYLEKWGNAVETGR